MDVTPGWVYLIAWLFAAAVGFAVLWAVIRSAVTSGLRKHHEWVETRSTSGNAE